MTLPDPVQTATDGRRRPVPVDVAVWSYIVVALANVAVGAWMLSFVPAVIAGFERSGKPAPAQAIAFTYVTIIGATVLFSGALAFFALRLRRGSTWARPALLTVSLLSLAALLAGGGPGLIVVVLCAAAAVLVMRSPVTAWLRAMRGLPPG